MTKSESLLLFPAFAMPEIKNLLAVIAKTEDARFEICGTSAEIQAATFAAQEEVDRAMNAATGVFAYQNRDELIGIEGCEVWEEWAIAVRQVVQAATVHGNWAQVGKCVAEADRTQAEADEVRALLGRVSQ